ncbi:hypothetical protein POJ06DRAFT_270569 [Lipomyces tetrasporus]|uniref:Uncharacterized protein n=1 Tax=Lipomyces tetrasporus TaxID=54092 RepID=A0AAD7QLZ5_9ASCO|nr:uncharacterized protein POJ06DRAFT_270569 [Lipomyces tetrasporus]KAJ8097752.1 hypothetical protein POJ06DRAFT_270569 [Lipomyces tetrasporus]
MENIETSEISTSERSISPLDLSGIGHALLLRQTRQPMPTPTDFTLVTDMSLPIPFEMYMRKYIQAVVNFRALGCIYQRDSQFLTYAHIDRRTLNITINSPNYILLEQALDTLLTILYVTQDYQVYSIQSLLVKKFLEAWYRLMRSDVPISMSVNVPCGLALLSRYLSIRVPWVDSDQWPTMLKTVVFFSLLSRIDLPLLRESPTWRLYIDVAKKSFDAISDAVFVTRMLDYHASIYLVLDTLLDLYFEVNDAVIFEKVNDLAYRIVSKPFIEKLLLHRRSYASLPNCVVDVDLVDHVINRAIQAIMRDKSIQGGGADEIPCLITNALRFRSDLDMQGVYANILGYDRRVAAGLFCLGAFVWMTTSVRR